MAASIRELTAGVAVSVSNLTRRYGSRTILNNISLDIPEGEFVALLGRSGSGKTTLLRALAQLDWDAAGSGSLHVTDSRSVVFQDARLLPWMQVLPNVILGLQDSDASALGIAMLAEVALTERQHAWPGQLSGGEQQRAALARSLVRQPKLLLADEPFGALDALTRANMHSLLRELCRRHRPAVVLVTHDVDEALLLADRILVLDGGRITIDDRPEFGQDRSLRNAKVQEYREFLLGSLGVRSTRGSQ